MSLTFSKEQNIIVGTWLTWRAQKKIIATYFNAHKAFHLIYFFTIFAFIETQISFLLETLRHWVLKAQRKNLGN